jgi:hypothetical protein
MVRPAGKGPIDVYLEVGKKRTFATARDWPGWSRSGRDEAAALATLHAYGARYARALRGSGVAFDPPADPSAFAVSERLAGGAGTEFGVPDNVPEADARPMGEAELARAVAILEACWAAFDAATHAATGKELRKGPRGGGRDLEKIIAHVQGAEAAYLRSLGGAFKADEAADPRYELARTREAVLAALPAAARGDLPARGPRGGARWPPRYFVRRAAWHVLDHAWEIEDRVE